MDSLPTKQSHSPLCRDRSPEYQAKTITSHNQARVHYLPIFPAEGSSLNNPLLLANVSIDHLTSYELARRLPGTYSVQESACMSSYEYSSTNTLCLSQEDAEALAQRLQVDLSIIIFNAIRFRNVCNTFLLEYESYRENILEQHYVVINEPQLQSKYMVKALEFFLQMDVDLFYMKTCSFRGAQPRSINEGLFCGSDTAEARYSMQPCGSPFCLCCHPYNQSKKTQSWSVVDFTSSSTHRFVNGYTSYLNCPATCDTNNIVYAMTCPCGEYEYVDSTQKTLSDVMTYHRNNVNEIIHEKLTGTPLFREGTHAANESQKNILRKMRVYQHAAKCPVALRTFLDCNPSYWCFIPLRWYAAEEENSNELRQSSGRTRCVMNIIQMGANCTHRVNFCLNNVPIPPARANFSYRQRQAQRVFFENFLPLPSRCRPYSRIDLYKFSIIAVLPDDSSPDFGYIIKQLFAVHGETKLNMICPIGGDPQLRYGRPFRLDWCNGLRDPSSSSTNPY